MKYAGIFRIIGTLLIVGGTRCSSFTTTTDHGMDAPQTDDCGQEPAIAYLENNDPICTAIKNRVIADLKRNVDPESADNKKLAATIPTLSKEKQDLLEAVMVRSLNEYAAATHCEAGTLFREFKSLGSKEREALASDYEIRVRCLGGAAYAAEFWEDGLAVHSEAHAAADARDLAVRASAQPSAIDRRSNADAIMKAYAQIRTSIQEGRQERFKKVMALLYTREADGSLMYHDPFQSVIDFR